MRGCAKTQPVRSGPGRSLMFAQPLRSLDHRRSGCPSAASRACGRRRWPSWPPRCRPRTASGAGGASPCGTPGAPLVRRQGAHGLRDLRQLAVVEEMAIALEEPGRGRRDSLRVAPQVREGNLFVVAAVKDESWWQLRGRVWPVLRERPLEFPVLLSAPERNGDQQETRDRLAALRLSDVLEQRRAAK